MTLPFLISVPHGGRRVPDEVKPYCVLAPRDIVEDGDEGASEIYRCLEGEAAAFVTTDVARAIIDLNRAEDDRRPDGVVKTHTCMNVKVYDRSLDETIVENLLQRHYRPYHSRLTRLASSGVFMGIDCHTMLAIGPPTGPMAGQQRPRLCLGNADGTSCSPRWLDLLASCLQETFGVEVARNDPFKGGYITRAHSSEIPWIQIEMSRADFLSNHEKGKRVTEALRRFAAELDRSDDA